MFKFVKDFKKELKKINDKIASNEDNRKFDINSSIIKGNLNSIDMIHRYNNLMNEVHSLKQQNRELNNNLTR